jgi:hypothetical protein
LLILLSLSLLLCTVPRQTMDTGGKVDGIHDSTSRFHTQDGLRCILQYRQYTRRILTGNDLLIEKLGRVKCIVWGTLLLTLLSLLLLLLLMMMIRTISVAREEASSSRE